MGMPMEPSCLVYGALLALVLLLDSGFAQATAAPSPGPTTTSVQPTSAPTKNQSLWPGRAPSQSPTSPALAGSSADDDDGNSYITLIAVSVFGMTTLCVVGAILGVKAIQKRNKIELYKKTLELVKEKTSQAENMEAIMALEELSKIDVTAEQKEQQLKRETGLNIAGSTNPGFNVNAGTSINGTPPKPGSNDPMKKFEVTRVNPVPFLDEVMAEQWLSRAGNINGSYVVHRPINATVEHYSITCCWDNKFFHPRISVANNGKSLKYHKKAAGLTIGEAVNKLRSKMPVEEGGVSFYLSSEIVNSNFRQEGSMGLSNSAYKYSTTSAYVSAYAHTTNYERQEPAPVPSPRGSDHGILSFEHTQAPSSRESGHNTPEPAWRAPLPRNYALPQTKTML